MAVKARRKVKYDQPYIIAPIDFEELWARVGDGNVPFPEYAEDPVGFIERLSGSKLTKEQKDVCISVRDNEVTNVQACHGVGKSFLAAWLVVWYVFSVGGIAVTTAPTNRQVEEIIWSTIRQAHAHNKTILGGNCGTKQMRLSETARAFGFAPRDYDDNSFNGIHQTRLLLVQDESCGIKKAVDDGFESCATGSLNRILRIGNPIVPYTPFHEHCKIDKYKMSAFEHPNVKWAYEVPTGCEWHRLKPEIAAQILNKDGRCKPQKQWPDHLPRDVVDGAVSVNWIEKIRVEKKEGSNYWISRVEGEFPLSAIDNIFPMLAVEILRQDSLEKLELIQRLCANQPLTAAADIGDGGDDSSITILRGKTHIYSEKMPTLADGKEGERLSQRLFQLSKKFGDFQSIAYDATGVGSWLQSPLERWYTGRTIRIKWGESANDDRFTTIKAEQFDAVARAIVQRDRGIWLIAEEESWKEICEQMGITTKITTVNDKMAVIPKEKLRKEYGRSTDMLDSFVMAYAVVLGHAKGKNAQSEPGALRQIFAMSAK